MRHLNHLFITFLLMLCAHDATAQETNTFTVDLWPDTPAVASVNAADTARLYVFLPATPARQPRRAVLICPGGGYTHLALDYEGTAWAPYFNSMGIAAIVLKYRMPHGDRRVPVSDAEEALRVIHANADAWGIDPADIGIMGSSAGGHLATTIATHTDAALRPAFSILCYPVVSLDPALTHSGSRSNFLGADATADDEHAYSNATQVADDTPRAIVLLSADDGAVNPRNGIDYCTALLAHGVPAALHVYPSGGHGWGMRTSFLYHTDMLADLRSWLHSF